MEATAAQLQALKAALGERIVGQQRLVERLLIGLLADGHLLVEGVPGLAKTRAVRALAGALDASFRRVQFTPDLLPADITGSEIFQQTAGGEALRFAPGPVFANVLLADEINRAPAKVQSALLEAMEERQVTAGGVSHALPDPFMVIATQNPIEHEGTFPLPEAQLDRFLMHVRVGYPERAEEIAIVRMRRAEESAGGEGAGTPAPLDTAAIMTARKAVSGVHVAAAIDQYVCDLVAATREPAPFSAAIADAIEHGASPRAALAMDRCARAHALLQGRDFVTPEDVRAVAHDCLRHRILLSYQALGAGTCVDALVSELLELVAVP